MVYDRAQGVRKQGKIKKIVKICNIEKITLLRKSTKPMLFL